MLAGTLAVGGERRCGTVGPGRRRFAPRRAPVTATLGGHAGPGRRHDRDHVEVGHGGQRVDHLGPVPGLFEGAPIGVKAYFAYINSKGGVNGRKLLRRRQGRRLQRAAERDRDPGGHQPATSPWWAASRSSTATGARPWPADTAVPDVVGDARPWHRTRCPTTSAPSRCLGSGDLGPVAVLQEALPQGHDTSGPSSRTWPRPRTQMARRARRASSRGLQDRLRRRRQPAADRLHDRRHQHEEQGRERRRPDRHRLAGRGHLHGERGRRRTGTQG